MDQEMVIRRELEDTEFLKSFDFKTYVKCCLKSREDEDNGMSRKFGRIYLNGDQINVQYIENKTPKLKPYASFSDVIKEWWVD